MRSNRRIAVHDLLSSLSLPKAILVSLSTLWLAIEIVRQTYIMLHSPLLHSQGIAPVIVGYALSTSIVFMGFVFPQLLAIHVYSKVKAIRRQSQNRISVCKAIYEALEGNLGVGIFCILFPLLSPFFILFEILFNFSGLPLLMPICGLIGIGIGYTLFKQIRDENRIPVLNLVLIFTLAVQYFNWNDRKPLLRDAYRITTGMTGQEVEVLMADHRVGPPGPFVNHLENDGQLDYMTPSSADMVIVTVKNSKVEKVEFSMD